MSLERAQTAFGGSCYFPMCFHSHIKEKHLWEVENVAPDQVTPIHHTSSNLYKYEGWFFLLCGCIFIRWTLKPRLFNLINFVPKLKSSGSLRFRFDRSADWNVDVLNPQGLWNHSVNLLIMELFVEIAPLMIIVKWRSLFPCHFYL